MILHKIQKLSLWKQGMINGLMLSILIDLPFLAYISYDAIVEYFKTLMPFNESCCICGGDMVRNYSGFVILPIILSLSISFVCAIVQRSSLMRFKSKVFFMAGNRRYLVFSFAFLGKRHEFRKFTVDSLLLGTCRRHWLSGGHFQFEAATDLEFHLVGFNPIFGGFDGCFTF